VLDAHREQAVRLELQGLACGVQGPHTDARRPFDPFGNPRHRQATLIAGPGTFPGEDFRVDQHVGLVPCVGDIDDDQADMAVYLGGGQTNAGSRIHRFQHVGGQLADLARDRRHGGGRNPQPGIGVLKDFQ